MSDLSPKEAQEVIEEVLRTSFENDSSDFKDAARVVMSAVFVGPNADKIAKFTGLNRDKVVRPLARRLREQKVWSQQGIHCDWVDEEDGALAQTSLILDVLVAMGYVDVKYDSKPTNP